MLAFSPRARTHTHTPLFRLISRYTRRAGYYFAIFFTLELVKGQIRGRKNAAFSFRRESVQYNERACERQQVGIPPFSSVSQYFLDTCVVAESKANSARGNRI